MMSRVHRQKRAPSSCVFTGFTRLMYMICRTGALLLCGVEKACILYRRNYGALSLVFDREGTKASRIVNKYGCSALILLREGNSLPYPEQK